MKSYEETRSVHSNYSYMTLRGIFRSREVVSGCGSNEISFKDSEGGKKGKNNRK